MTSIHPLPVSSIWQWGANMRESWEQVHSLLLQLMQTVAWNHRNQHHIPSKQEVLLSYKGCDSA